MEIPAAADLLDRVSRLPAAPALLERVGDRPGIHLVGGAVRDLLLGGAPPDLDLAVEGDLSELVTALGGEVRHHDRFETAAIDAGGHRYDIARARTERYAGPGALPEVEPATLADDLARRDFTVNAAAIELGGPDAGRLRAVTGALDDLEARQLRVLHERSFIDDPTRLLRLVRYQARLGFEIEPHTRELARAAIAGDALATISGQRVGAELRLLAREPDPVAALAALDALGLEPAPGFGLTDEAVARRALALLPADGDPAVLVIGAAARGMAAAALAGWLDQLGFAAGARAAIVATATRSGELAVALTQARTPSEIAAAVGDGSAELVALAGALGAEQPAAEWLERLRHVKLEIDGRDLIDAGVAEGPAIGRGLAAALAGKLDRRISGREAELAEALRAAR